MDPSRDTGFVPVHDLLLTRFVTARNLAMDATDRGGPVEAPTLLWNTFA